MPRLADSSLATLHSAVASGGHHSTVGLIVVGIAFVVIGAVQALKPSFGYRMRRWQYKNPDAVAPSNAALMVARVAGVIAVVVGVVVIVIAASR